MSSLNNCYFQLRYIINKIKINKIKIIMAKKYVSTTLDEFIFESQQVDEGMFDKEHLKKAAGAVRKGAGWFAPSLLSVQQAIKAGLDIVKNSNVWQDRLEQVEAKLPAQKEKFLEFLGRNPEVKYFKWNGKEFVDTAHASAGGGGILVGGNKNQPNYAQRKNESMHESFDGNDNVYSFTWDTAVEVKNENGKWVIDRDGEDEEYVFDDILKEKGITYDIVNPHGPGGGWPEIEYTGTKEQLSYVMKLLQADSYSREEILEMLEEYDGEPGEIDHDTLLEILG
jgi:hypothetical protein